MAVYPLVQPLQSAVERYPFLCHSRDIILRQCRLGGPGDIGDIGDISDIHFDTIGTEIKNINEIFTRNSK